MTTTSKTDFAVRLGISAPRVSQYIAQGLPTLSDGSLDLSRALKWVAGNTLGPAGQRAKEILRETAGDDENNPAYASANIAIGVMFMIIPNIAQAAAIEAGAAPDVVERIPAIAHRLAMKRGDGMMAELLDMEPRGNVWPDLNFCMKIGKEG